ncbi:hypothetical protein [Lysobacter sp. HA18]
MIRILLLAAVLAPALAVAQDAAAPVDVTGEDISSQRDYTDPAQRDRPVACHAGDQERHAGATLGQVFGDAWPAPPAAATTRERPMVDRWGKLVMPDGLAPKNVTVVVAALVGPDGQPQRAEPLCTTDSHFDMAAARTVMRSHFTPARYDGAASTGVTVVVVDYTRGGPAVQGAHHAR